MIQKIINNIKRIAKVLWHKVRIKLIKVLGGYTYPPCPPESPEKPLIYAEKTELSTISASTIVSWNRYSKDRGYREYIKSELARILADHIIDEKLMSQEGIVEINDNECVVKVTAKLVKGEGM